jgi:hypothetical protein
VFFFFRLLQQTVDPSLVFAIDNEVQAIDFEEVSGDIDHWHYQRAEHEDGIEFLQAFFGVLLLLLIFLSDSLDRLLIINVKRATDMSSHLTQIHRALFEVKSNHV